MRINAEKAPFLTERLNITVIPTVLIVEKGKVADKFVGFDDLGGNDEFATDVLARRLRTAIRYDGNVYEDKEKPVLDENYDIFE